MKPTRHVRAAALLLLAFAAPPCSSQVPGLPAASPGPAKPERDPLGRETPYGCLIGFLRAAERAQYSRAAEYLDMPPSPEAVQRARQVQTLLNGLVSDIESASRKPEGDLQDGLPATRERVGAVHTRTRSLDILLQRRQRPGEPALWRVSADTLQQIPAVVAEIDTPGLESFVPRPLREIRLFSIPLYRWLGSVLGVTMVVVFAWAGTRLLSPFVRLLTRRIGWELGAGSPPWLRAPLRILLLAVGFRILGSLSLTVLGRQFWIRLAVATTIFGAVWLLIRMSDVAAALATRRLAGDGPAGRLAVLALVHRTFKIAAALAGVVVLVYASGRDVTAILAGVGLGGIAIAFAAQKTLENLFGGVAIISDEPIRVGDFCRFADKCGTVEDIGLRSTRIRTVDRTLLSIPNGQLSAMALENFTLRDQYLFNPKISLRYETTPAQLRAVLSGIRELLHNHSAVDPASARARLVEVGASSFNLELFAYLAAPGSCEFLEMQEELLLSTLDVIRAAGCGLAYPSQTLYMTRDRPVDGSPAKKFHPAIPSNIGRVI